MGDDRGEPVGLAGDPVGHVAAERAAHRGGAGGIDVVAGDGGVRDRHQVGERLGAPTAPAAGDERLPITGGQRRVGQQHRVALGDQQPGAPAPTPRVPRTQRAAVNPQQQRGGPFGARARGQGEPGANRAAVGGGGGHLGEGAGQVGRRGRVAQQFGGDRLARRAGGVQVDPDHLRRRQVRRPQRVHPAAVGGDLRVGEGGIIAGQPRHGVGRQVEQEDRPAPVGVGGQDDPAAVREPRLTGGPAVPAGGHPPDAAIAEVEEVQLVMGRAVRGGAGPPGEQDPVGVGGDERVAGVGVRVVDEDGAGAVVQVEPDQPAGPVAGGGDPGLHDDREAGVRGQVEVLELIRGRARGQVTQVEPDVVRVGSGGQRSGQQVGGPGTEVVIPMPHGVAGVQDGGDGEVLALLAEAIVVGFVGRRVQARCRDQDLVAVTAHLLEPAEPVADQPGVAAAGGQQPQGCGAFLVLVGVRIGTGGGEQQVAGVGEDRRRFALPGAGQPTRRLAAGRVDLPQRGSVLRAFAVECGDGGDQARPVGGEGQAGRPRQAEVGVDVVEGGFHSTTLVRLSVMSAIRRPGGAFPRGRGAGLHSTRLTARRSASGA